MVQLMLAMAAVAEMGEVDEMHSKEENIVANGELQNDVDMESSDSKDSTKKVNCEEQPMEVDDNIEDTNAKEPESSNDTCVDEKDKVAEVEISKEEVQEENDNSEEDEAVDEPDNNDSVKSEDDVKVVEIEDEVHEIDDDDNDNVSEDKNNGITESKDKSENSNETIELHDSGAEDDGDVMIIENTPKENGDAATEVIDLESTPEKKVKSKSKDKEALTPRRSSRNLNKQRSYTESDKEDEDIIAATHSSSEESDIEEILPEDPLAVNDSLSIERIMPAKSKSPVNSSSTIVVKDTKRLVEIASKSNANLGKKEPTLVIIDTNSILSGRGPVPVNNKPASITPSPYPTVLPMALPAQGMYPPNMRATITPIPINTSASPVPSSKTSVPIQQPPTPLLPTLTDDMFVVEAPSFIVPYVYEKPPVKEFKEFVRDIREQILKHEQSKDEEEDKKDSKDEEKKDKLEGDEKKDGEKEDEKNEETKDGDKETKESTDAENKNSENDTEKKDDEVEKMETKKSEEKVKDVVTQETKKDLDQTDPKKPYSYFESPLGKFFIDIGFNLVQEYVQSDLLRQQKRKRDRERGANPETEKTIQSLIKNLEFSKENNEPFRMPVKKCEFCNFKTESSLAMSYHLETPHMKNFVYKCNFCAYEVRSPHDILFHMEAEHAVRGHLERAPAFHQCPSCPFEDNQKGKLSRHLVACMRKFKPERNLEPPIDWEPPAKIPRVPKMRQHGLNATVSAYQAMSKTSQYQFLSKMQLQSTQQSLQRGRGRPSLGNIVKPQQMLRPAGMVFKQQGMTGGSVLVPTNYQLSGNQVFQVVGGQELGGRLGHPGQMAFVPNIPSASSTISSQNQNATKKPVHQPSISITPLPRATATATPTVSSKPGDSNSKNSFVICEICDGYIKDLEQLRNHMQWIHKIKIHPKMIYNRPPLNCQKCQFRFFTDQGLERHLLGSHGLVTSSMQDAANKSKDSGRCPVCGRVYQWKLLNHVARDHNMTLKPAHLSYKCTVCTATFGMYKQFENHVYSAHSVVAKRVMDKKNAAPAANKNDQVKPLKINDEITIIPQPAKSNNGASKEGSPSLSTGSNSSVTSTPSTSKNADSTTPNNSSVDQLALQDAKDDD